MVLADSHRISPVPRYSGYHYVCILCLYGALTLIAQFPTCFQFIAQYNVMVLQPPNCRNNMGLGSFPFARHYLGNHYYFLLLRLLRCFSSARSRIIQYTFSILGCPIRKSTDQFAFANPRSLSQLITSFIASESLGIPRVPFLTFFTLSPLLLSDRLLLAVYPKDRQTFCCLLLCLFSSNMSKNSLSQYPVVSI